MNRDARAVSPATPGPGAEWKALITATSEFDPEDDSTLLAWMAGEAAGMAGYAEAVDAVHETVATVTGLDPAALQALDDCGSAAANAAEQMAAARQRFTDHYAEVRQFAAAGGELPYNGRWMTNEGSTPVPALPGHGTTGNTTMNECPSWCARRHYSGSTSHEGEPVGVGGEQEGSWNALLYLTTQDLAYCSPDDGTAKVGIELSNGEDGVEVSISLSDARKLALALANLAKAGHLG